MNRIRVLPEILANKIAAGEIVERPASVVKELMENAIDAGSRSIRVTIQSGGKRLIRVQDDGTGMSQDDAILAFEHHATSKLQTAEDLHSIATLGFRGEALPSIASVSRLMLRTRQEGTDAASGTELEIQGGVLRSVKPVPWDKGTEITVRDLFFNVPARRKFLKADDTEAGHAARHVMHYALVYPEIRFTLQSGDRVLLDTVAVQTVEERIYQVFGDRFLDNLVKVDGSSGAVRVYGFTSRPNEQRTNAYSQYFFVNRRMVRDKVITGAVRQAYRRCMPATAYPVVILFLELPFNQVDVNAHPAKTEIRFHDQKAVFNLVHSSIERALSGDVAIPDYETSASRPYSQSGLEQGLRQAGDSGTIRETLDRSTHPALQKPYYARQDTLRYANQELADPFPEFGEAPDPVAIPPETDDKGQHAGVFKADSIRILGQFRDSYIIASDREGLLIIDQHVAHERILYEEIAASMQETRVKTQGLLTPFTVDLAPHQAALVEKVMPELEESGFDVEFFGGSSILVRAVPAIVGESDCRTLLREIFENLEPEDRGMDLERIRDRIAVQTACHAAVKVNMPLSQEKMEWLVERLFRTRMPVNCPHGRPIILRFSNHEIEKKFGRV